MLVRVVEYLATECPACKTRCSRVTRTWKNLNGIMRLHRCRGCGHQFASKQLSHTVLSTTT
jgi:hypothetical protein